MFEIEKMYGLWSIRKIKRNLIFGGGNFVCGTDNLRISLTTDNGNFFPTIDAKISLNGENLYDGKNGRFRTIEDAFKYLRKKFFLKKLLRKGGCWD